MKKTIRETNTLSLILTFIWSIGVLIGSSYLVFYKGINGWWFILAVYLMTFSLSSKRTEIEE